MPTRESAPPGAPCWTDLWTSDVEGSRRFYGELFGWEAQEPSPEFEGYFMFTRGGIPIAGAMGDMGGMPANDTWKIYLSTDDLTGTLEAAEAGGAQVTVPAVPVADLGIQTVFTDATGATLGAWQPGTFPGFTVLAEHGAPSWFELYTRDHDAAVAFYRTVFALETTVVANSDEFRYTALHVSGHEGEELGGILDAGGFLPAGAPAHWMTYWEVDDVDASASSVGSLGGSVLAGPSDSPYGRMATVADPAGAQFKLRTG